MLKCRDPENLLADFKFSLHLFGYFHKFLRFIIVLGRIVEAFCIFILHSLHFCLLSCNDDLILFVDSSADVIVKVENQNILHCIIRHGNLHDLTWNAIAVFLIPSHTFIDDSAYVTYFRTFLAHDHITIIYRIQQPPAECKSKKIYRRTIGGILSYMTKRRFGQKNSTASITAMLTARISNDEKYVKSLFHLAIKIAFLWEICYNICIEC